MLEDGNFLEICHVEKSINCVYQILYPVGQVVLQVEFSGNLVLDLVKVSRKIL